MTTAALLRLGTLLERLVIGLALGALAFRATLYGALPRAAGAAFGTADVIDFVLALALFALCTAAGVVGVVLTTRAADDGMRARAWRPALVGMTTFVVYYLLHPLVATPGATALP